MAYDFDSPEVVTYNEEYYVMSFIALVGLVGGNLGLFIGLSVSGLVSSLLLYIRDKTFKFTHKGNSNVAVQVMKY